LTGGTPSGALPMAWSPSGSPRLIPAAILNINLCLARAVFPCPRQSHGVIIMSIELCTSTLKKLNSKIIPFIIICY
ncbi:hypothetical protein, partial [Klebsiella pneumoniae]|uniref:hypothetical protein n=1 Tax=Klebsiella pneumoniae TaxID=573 RepID=UPI001B8B0355